MENGAPEKDSASERDQTEKRPKKIVPAINEGILNPEIEDRDVFLDLHTLFFSFASSTASLIAAIMLSGRAIPFPAISKAVPWSGLVRGKGRPSVTFTP